jgi:hypothetical protein
MVSYFSLVTRELVILSEAVLQAQRRACPEANGEGISVFTAAAGRISITETSNPEYP